MIPSLEYICGIVASAYVTTCLVVAAVRWFHMCRPYQRNPRYYYPGRPFVTSALLSTLALLPYVLHPESADAWFLARTFFLPVVLFHFALMLFSYFGVVMEWQKWQVPVMLLGLPVGTILLSALLLALLPDEQIGEMPFLNTLLFIVGGLATLFLLFSMGIIWIWARRFDPDDFSNPADFPIAQAQRWVAMILINMTLCWTGAVLNSPAVLAMIQVLIATSCVVFVITALHPNRNKPVEDPVPEPHTIAATATESHRPLPKKKQAEILAAIRFVVEKERAYLDPHLTLQDVASRCGYSRTYISALVKEQMGGFVNYVNRFRLEYVEKYMESNPDATLSEAIDAAGFGSRPSYYHMKERLQEVAAGSPA